LGKGAEQIQGDSGGSVNAPSGRKPKYMEMPCSGRDEGVVHSMGFYLEVQVKMFQGREVLQEIQ
jgi:hypothetical protein